VEKQFLRPWTLAILAVAHAGPVVLAFFIEGRTAQTILAFSCLTLGIAIAASWRFPKLHGYVWTPEARANSGHWNATAGTLCEIGMGVFFLLGPNLFTRDG
jgi:hypothetical protein